MEKDERICHRRPSRKSWDPLISPCCKVFLFSRSRWHQQSFYCSWQVKSKSVCPFPRKETILPGRRESNMYFCLEVVLAGLLGFCWREVRSLPSVRWIRWETHWTCLKWSQRAVNGCHQGSIISKENCEKDLNVFPFTIAAHLPSEPSCEQQTQLAVSVPGTSEPDQLKESGCLHIWRNPAFHRRPKVVWVISKFCLALS